MASGTIKTIQFSTKKADELAKVFPAESTKFLASGWGLTENSPRGGVPNSTAEVVTSKNIALYVSGSHF